MHAYRNIKLTEAPDVGDIKAEGRRSAVGKIRRDDPCYWGRASLRIEDDVRRPHNDRGYNRPAAKAVVRRALKKADRRLQDMLDREVAKEI